MSDRRFATAADGTRLAYRLWGNPEAKDRVALVHALAMSAEYWEDTVAELGPDISAVAVDCRGHGQSGKPAGPYTVELFANDLAAVLDHCGWSDAVIGGASMGGCVAQAFAHRHADRTRALALMDTTAWYGPEAPDAWEGRAQKALQDGLDALVDFQKTRWFTDAFRENHPDRVEKPVTIFLANDLPAYAETCRMLGRCDLREALPGFAMPVSILVGEEDYATPVKMAEALRDAIPGATMEVMPDARHFTPLEHPGAIASFLSATASAAR